MQKRS